MENQLQQKDSYKNLRERDKLSLWIILLLLCIETVFIYSLYSIKSIHDYFISYQSLGLLVITIILIGGIIGCFIDAERRGFKFYFKKILVTRLLGNIISPRKLGIGYLLFFIIHIGWITNGSFSLLSAQNTELSFRSILPLVIAIAGAIALACAFPAPYVKKNNNPVNVFISGISYPIYPTPNPLEKSIKTYFKDEIPLEISKTLRSTMIEGWSLLPLIRILQHMNNNNENILHIILSNSYNDNSFNNIKFTNLDIDILKRKNHQTIIEDNWRARLYELKKDLEESLTLFTDTSKNYLFEKYGILPSGTRYMDVLKIIIKSLGTFEFPDQKDTIKKLIIEFSEPCDYNDYNKCYDIANNVVKGYDDNNHLIRINSTPGTALITSVLTLLAIDVDRELYYFKQFDNNVPIEDKLKEVDKSKVPILELIAQSMDKLAQE